MINKIFKVVIYLSLYSCSTGPDNKVPVKAPDAKPSGYTAVKTNKAEETVAVRSVLDGYIMEGYEKTEFTQAFFEKGIEMRVREIGYQHGHTIFAMTLNLYKHDKMVFTDTIPFYPDPSVYELLYLGDSTPLVKVSGTWANMGAGSYQEDFYLVENDSIYLLPHVSGYCGGDHYNFDWDSTCITQLLDAYEFRYTLSRKKGEKYISVIKQGRDMSAEDPCKAGLDTLNILELSVMNKDTLLVYHSQETAAGKKKVLVSIPKAQAIKKLSQYKTKATG